jgi:putative membrane protein
MLLLVQHSGFNIELSGLTGTLTLLIKTVQLRPYVFLFLAASLFSAKSLIGWQRTGVFFAIAWVTAFACEFSSTRTGIPFGWYHYTGSTVGQELYLSNVPFMDSLSFTMLLFASYCLALGFLLPSHGEDSMKDVSSKKGRLLGLTLDRSIRTGWPVFLLTGLFFAFIDMVIDPVALRGDRWFLGKIYYYPNPGIHFGVPVANYVGWAMVGAVSLLIYFCLDRRLPEPGRRSDRSVTNDILMGCGLYYSILLFNLTVTFWIDEPLIGMNGILIYIPLTALLLLRLFGKLPAPATRRPPDDWAVNAERLAPAAWYSRVLLSHRVPLVTVRHPFDGHGPLSDLESLRPSNPHHR